MLVSPYRSAFFAPTMGCKLGESILGGDYELWTCTEKSSGTNRPQDHLQRAFASILGRCLREGSADGRHLFLHLARGLVWSHLHRNYCQLFCHYSEWSRRAAGMISNTIPGFGPVSSSPSLAPHTGNGEPITALSNRRLAVFHSIPDCCATTRLSLRPTSR